MMARFATKLLGVLGGLLLFGIGGGLLWAGASLIPMLPSLSSDSHDTSHYIVQVGSVSISGGWMYGLLALLVVFGGAFVLLSAFIIRSMIRTTRPD